MEDRVAIKLRDCGWSLLPKTTVSLLFKLVVESVLRGSPSWSVHGHVYMDIDMDVYLNLDHSVYPQLQITF